MSAHVFAWIAGFGRTLMPFGPTRFSRRGSGVRIEHAGLSALFDPEAGELAGDAGAVEVLEGAAYEDWTHGARHDHWRIETSVLSVAWPDGWDVVTGEPFDLVGPDGRLVWLQRPKRIPPLAEMIGDGQRVDRIEGQRIELAYVHEGEAWRQMHRIAGPCVVTGQGKETLAALVRSCVEEMAATLRPSGADG